MAQKHNADCACPSCFARVARGVEAGKPSQFRDGRGTGYVWAVEETYLDKGKERVRWCIKHNDEVTKKDILELICDLYNLVGADS